MKALNFGDFLSVFLACGAAVCQNSAPAADSQPSFKAEANLVLVPVVVRDASGNAIGNLKEEDFELFDKGKTQEITSFTLEETTPRAAENRSLPPARASATTATQTAEQSKLAPMAIPQRFIALLFDDLHLEVGGPGEPAPGTMWPGELVATRKAAQAYIATLRPSDRVAIFTTSGAAVQDFTSDRDKLLEAIRKWAPSHPQVPMIAGSHLIDVAGQHDSQKVIIQTGDIVRRMARLPGQHAIVLLSPGMMLHDEGALPWSQIPETMVLIDHAIRSQVVINCLDTRGLYSKRNGVYDEFPARLADGTGGRFIRDTNDMDGSLRQLATAPRFIYVLGFSPADLKPDGSFHDLKVKLRDAKGLDLEARKGYWAPDAKELARRQNQPAAGDLAAAPRVSEDETKEISEALGIVPKPEPSIAPTPPPSTPAPAPVPAPGEAEISTRDEPATFRAQTNLVQVPVVVRDREGHAVGNLRKEDFRVLDKGKRQEIAKFIVEKTAPAALMETRAQAPPPSAGAAPATPAPVPATRFVAFVFDDRHMQFADLPQVRDAVRRYLRSSLQPGDRVALFTTSGKGDVDFTTDPEALDKALLAIRPSPLTMGNSCFHISYFQAVQIDQQVTLHPSSDDVNKSVALKAAVFDGQRCANLDFNTVVVEIRDAFLNGKQETRSTLATLRETVRRMALLPGRRSIILASPGFFVSPEMQDQSNDLIALAIRSKVLINTIDARGVWTLSSYGADQPGLPPPADIITFKQSEGTVADDEMFALAEGTGGTANFNNDFDGGVRKAAAAPECLYILGFDPPNLKFDGSFHALKVTVNASDKVSVQARRGYWAPKQAEGADAVVKQEIEDAVFSRDEIHNLPVEMHTQVTREGSAVKLDVLTSVDLKLVHYRKADDRHRNDVTIIACLFDPNGNFVAGVQKTLQLRLRDETMGALSQKPPVIVTSDFDVKPGEYLVRLVARDAEHQQLTTENAAVDVP
jgi:VWFA-related protein